jgi:hypothetical protein
MLKVRINYSPNPGKALSARLRLRLDKGARKKTPPTIG